MGVVHRSFGSEDLGDGAIQFSRVHMSSSPKSSEHVVSDTQAMRRHPGSLQNDGKSTRRAQDSTIAARGVVKMGSSVMWPRNVTDCHQLHLGAVDSSHVT